MFPDQKRFHLDYTSHYRHYYYYLPISGVLDAFFPRCEGETRPVFYTLAECYSFLVHRPALTVSSWHRGVLPPVGFAHDVTEGTAGMQVFIRVGNHM